MTINVNNQTYIITENSSVQHLLERLQIDARGIAIAVNNNVVPKESWEQTTLQQDDQIVIIQATQGG